MSTPTFSHAWRVGFRAVLFLGSTILSVCAYSESAFELNSRGYELYNAKEYGKATELFQRAYKLHPEDDSIRNNLVNAGIMYSQELYAQGELKNAIEWLEYIIEVDPKNVKPLNQLGDYLLFEGEIAAAIFRLEESIELAPKDLDAHFLLGEAYYKDNDVTAAINQWEWVYKVNKDYPALMDRLENALREEHVEYDFQGDRSRNFNVTYSQEAEGALVKDVLRILEGAYRDVGKTLGGAYPPPPIQVSLYTTEGFFESTQMGEFVGALYDGTKIRCPVIDKRGQRVSLEILEPRLKHEYVHVVVRHVARNNIPWWFNEGLAETLSSDLSTTEKNILKIARTRQALFPLIELTPQDTLKNLTEDELSLAYAQSHATVLYLEQKFGKRKYGIMLQHLRSGLSAEEALRQTYRMNFRMLESQVNIMIDRL